MSGHSIMDSREFYRHPRTVWSAPTTIPLASSQQVCRYQATHMPPPTYDLDREEERASVPTIVIRTLAFVATGAVIDLIQRVGPWLKP